MEDECENAYRMFYCASLRGLTFGIYANKNYNLTAYTGSLDDDYGDYATDLSNSTSGAIDGTETNTTGPTDFEASGGNSGASSEPTNEQ